MFQFGEELTMKKQKQMRNELYQIKDMLVHKHRNCLN